MDEGPVQQKALIGPEDTINFTGGYDLDNRELNNLSFGRKNYDKLEVACWLQRKSKEEI